MQKILGSAHMTSIKIKLTVAFLLWVIFSFSASAFNTQIGFVKNEGQIQAECEYYFKADQFAVLLSKKGLRYVQFETNNYTLHTHSIDITFKNQNADLLLKPVNIQAKVNFYQNGLTQQTKSYSRVIYENIYPKIDLHYFINSAGKLKYEYHVKPGGNPKHISMVYGGFKNELFIDNEGRLQIPNSLHTITEKAPVCFDNKQNEISGKYTLNGCELGFEIADYNKNNTLIIDPYIEWSTFLGGQSFDEGVSLSHDRQQNLYVVGNTFSADLNVGVGAHQNTISDSSDAFISKFNEKGKLIWATFLGGSKNDSAVAVKTTLKGDLYVLLNTYSNNLPVSNRAFQKQNNGGKEGYLAKFDSSGVFIWGTYLGGKKLDNAKALHLVRDSIMYLTGFSTSTDFPTTTNAHQTTISGDTDAFIMKLDTSGAIKWSTYYGGKGGDAFNALCASDSFASRIYLAGFTTSINIDSLSKVVQHTLTGKTDALIACFAENGSLKWNSYFGGDKFDMATGIASNQNGQIVVIGKTATTDTTLLPVNTPDSFQLEHGGGKMDGFVLGLNGKGQKQFFTFYGGSSEEEMNSIDFYMYAYLITGNTQSNNLFINHHGSRKTMTQKRNKGANDGFYFALDTNARFITGSYLGGNNNEKLNQGIYYNGAQSFVGKSTSNNYPISDSANQKNRAGASDMVLTTLCGDIFKRVGPYGCHDRARVGTVFADDFKGYFKKKYRWQKRTLFDWVELVDKDSAAIRNQFIKQKTHYRRIYDVGLCHDTSFATSNINGPEPRASFTYTGRECLGDTIAFTNNSTVTYGSMRMNWRFKFEGSTSDVNPKHVFSLGDTNHVVWLTVISDSNCVSIKREKIFISNTPKADFKVDSICNRDTVFLRSRVSNVKYYFTRWQIDNKVFGQRVVPYLFDPNKNYTVKLIASTPQGCTDSISKSFTVDSALIADFSLYNTCPGDTLQITNNSEYKKPLNYLKWYLGENDSSFAANPRKVFDTTGVYSIRLFMEDKDGCRDSATRILRILDKPRVAFSYSKDCKNDTFLFKLDSSEYRYYRYHWLLGDGTTFNTAFPIVHVYDSVKDYTVKVVGGIGPNLACADSSSQTIYNDSLFVIGMEIDGKCDNQPIIFKNQTEGTNDSTKFEWRLGNTVISNQRNYKSNLPADTFLVSLKVTNGPNCIDSTSKFILISLAPQTAFTADTVCPTDSVFFNNETIEGKAITNYKWKFGDGDSSIIKSPYHQFAPGQYSVVLIAQNQFNCTDSLKRLIYQPDSAKLAAISKQHVLCYGDSTGSIQLAVLESNGKVDVVWNTNPPKNTLFIDKLSAGKYTVTGTDGIGCKSRLNVFITQPDALIASSINDTSLCLGDEYKVSAQAQGGLGPYLYQWGCLNPPCTRLSTVRNNATIKSNDSDSYYYYVIDSNGCKTDSIWFSVGFAPNVRVRITDYPRAVLADTEFEIEAYSIEAEKYSWTPSIIFSDPNKAKTTASVSSSTTVTVKATAKGYCPDEASVKINVVDLNIPTAFTPNNDGVNDTWVIRNLDLVSNSKLTIYSRWGGILFSSKNNEEQWNGWHNGKTVPAGAYLYILEIDGKQALTGYITVLE
jgi:gliding motility-associated-like protein